MRRARGLGPLLIVGIVLSLFYGPAGFVLVMVVAGAISVGRCYRPLPAAAERRLRLPGSGRLARRFRRRSSGRGPELLRLRAGLEWALRDSRQADAVLRPALVRTAESLVRGRTGHGLADDPAAARVLLGPELQDYLASRDAASPTPVQLAAMLTRLEALR